MRTKEDIANEKNSSTDGNREKPVSPVISGASMKWGNERYELFRWTWAPPYNRRTFSEWGYITFDRKAHRWFRINAYRILRDDVRPSAWLSKNGLFAIANGFCSDLRVYKLSSDKGITSFRVPVKDIRGHMVKIARLFTNRGSRQEHPRTKAVAKASLAVTNVQTAGPFKEDLDISCLIETENGNRYDAIYTIRNGRLIGTSATKQNING
jgi:hypothetical protein